MKSLFASLVVVACGVGLGPAAAAADVTTVRGEVVDLACSLAKGAEGRGDAHAACAMTCARRGDQMALVTDDDVLVIEGSYTANSNAKLLDFVARRVEAKGTITRDGRRYLNIAAMMVQK